MTETDLDTAALESYLSAELAVDTVETEVLNDGLNLTLAISAAEGDRAYVLRRPTALRESGLFIDLRQEYRLLQRLRETAIPAPAPVSFCDDESVIGDRFFVITHLDGSTIPLGSDLPERYKRERARERGRPARRYARRNSLAGRRTVRSRL